VHKSTKIVFGGRIYGLEYTKSYKRDVTSPWTGVDLEVKNTGFCLGYVHVVPMASALILACFNDAIKQAEVYADKKSYASVKNIVKL